MERKLYQANREKVILKNTNNSMKQNIENLDQQLISEIKTKESEIKNLRDKVVSQQAEISSHDHTILQLQSAGTQIRTELNSKLRDLETMGNVIEDHTKQLDQIEMKEKNILEREEELKKLKYELAIEQEKCRLHAFENSERETRLRDKENRVKDRGDLMNLAIDADADKQELKLLTKEIEVIR